MRTLSLVLLALAACTALPGSSGDNTPLRPTAGRDRLEVSGRAFLIAPVAGAHISLTRLGRQVEQIQETTTGPDGAWLFDLTAVDGDLLIEVRGDRGGSSIEPVTGVAPISLSQDDHLATIVPRTKLGEARSGVAINALTTLITARTLADARAGASVPDSWAKNSSLFSAHFDSPEPWSSEPIDLVQRNAPGISSGAIYSFVALAMSQHALELGRRAGVTDVSVVNSWTVLRLLERDLEDKVFDGKASGVELPAVAANVRIDAETTRASLAKALESFLSSENNKSGFGARDLTKLLTAIRTDKSELYPAGEPELDRDPTVESGSPPDISIVAPMSGQVVGQNSRLTAVISDLDGVSDASVWMNGNLTSLAFDRSNPTKWTIDVVFFLQNGEHVVELRAVDAKGNAAKKEVRFTYDAAAPSIAFLACHAPNDLLRSVTTSAGGATFAPTAPDDACLETTLDSGDQQFHTFADLLVSARADTPRVDLTVTDATEIASVTCQLTINGNAVGPPMPCVEGAEPATHVIPINGSVFGNLLADLDVTDSVAVRVVATDSLGNTSERIIAFRVHVLPTPLHIAPTPLTPQSALSSYSFAADNVDKLFDPATFPDKLVHLNAYNVTNLSARPTKLSITAGFENESVSWTRRTYKTPYRLYGNAVSDGVGVCGNGQALKFLRYGSFVSNQCVTPTALTTMETMSTGVIPTFPFEVQRLVFAANGVQLAADDNHEVELAPGQTYKILLATRYPAFTGNPTDNACRASFYPEWTNHQNLGAPSAAGGFLRKNPFFTNVAAGVTHSFYGYLSCSSNIIYSCPSTGICAFDAMVENGSVYPVSYVRIERDLRFTTSASWTPKIRLSSSSAVIPAKADRTGLAITQSYVSENAKPPAELGFSVAGW